MRTFRKLLLLLFVALASAQPVMAAPFASAAPSDPGADEEKLNRAFAVDWAITISNQSSWEDRYTKESTNIQTSIKGSAYVSYHTTASDPTPTDAQVEQFLLTAEYNSQFVQTGQCNRLSTRRSIVDPARYVGDPSIVESGWHLSEPLHWAFVPWKGDDGSWYMADPVARIPFSRIKFTYEDQLDYVTCIEAQHRKSTFQATVEAMNNYFSPKLRGDAEGTTFVNEESRVAGNNIIHYRVMVQLLGNECALYLPPVDAKDPLIKDVDVELEADTQVIPPNRIGTLQPPAPVTFTLRVTCDGIPIKNAEAHIEVEVRNGGHQHGTGNSRPRGYLNGKRLTEEEPKIQVKTNEQGVATITFLPGRDTLTGSRGIAGTYLVTARLDDERFSNREETRVVLVKRTDFVPLFVGDDTYVVVRGDTQEHPAGTWGQPITMDAIARLAEEFQAAQEQHNQELIALGE